MPFDFYHAVCDAQRVVSVGRFARCWLYMLLTFWHAGSCMLVRQRGHYATTEQSFPPGRLFHQMGEGKSGHYFAHCNLPDCKSASFRGLKYATMNDCFSSSSSLARFCPLQDEGRPYKFLAWVCRVHPLSYFLSLSLLRVLSLSLFFLNW